MPATSESVYQIKVSLNWVTPPVWRRFIVRSSTDLQELHHILQTVMGWTNSHLHQFIDGDTFYGVPDANFGRDINDESGVRLDSMLRREGQSILYEYDFASEDHCNVFWTKCMLAFPYACSSSLQPPRLQRRK